MRWKRRRLLARAIHKRHELVGVLDRTNSIEAEDVLCFAVVRNESVRLPWFLEHHRRLGVAHFLIVDNDSDDGTDAVLAAQPDVSLWRTGAGYKASRFGVDWVNWLLARYGHGHWCLTLDADETLVYPYWDTRDLRALTAWLDGQGRAMLGAMMLDIYPKGPVGAQSYLAGDDPFTVLEWFDPGNYSVQVQQPMGNLWLQGGPRARAFFSDDPRRAPTLNKVPLVRWNRRFAYVNSTHSLLPPRLNHIYETDGGEAPSGLLLHSKFLNVAVARAGEEKMRGEHFSNSALYDSYYDAVAADPDLWCAASRRLTGWRGMEALGLMSRGGWV
ncbi:glycosyl transferase family 2 [Gemmobacter aquarius]|uniref:Glycosyl transferase family 2 n=1 Tax=Paragemmobacter aquarius TaxID=2169400 RepID=A0A2S0URN2_9RHOB|nr:glycosyl transferase family 2 [Gemmobacter aquarius]